MSLHPWPQLLRRIRNHSPLLGLDVGSKTIGLAISDPLRRQATPLTTITRTRLKDDLAALAAIANARGARGMVMGLPLNMDGSEGEMAQRIRSFAAEVLRHKRLFTEEPEIALVDERLSTAAMDDFMIEHGVPRQRRDAVIDKLAAHVILQSALSALAPASPTPPDKP